MTATESTRTSGQESIATTVPEWEGPFLERDRYGDLTDASYVRCPDCEIEVIVGDKARAHHRDGCRHE